MESSRVTNLIDVYTRGLLEDTVPFWTKHCVDREHGGFMMSLGDDGRVVDTDKGVWQQCRFTWLLAKLYNTCGAKSEWLSLAKHGANFMDRHCFDPADGRMWFHLTRDGQPIRKRRYAFSESFAAIAYGELFKATGETQFADKATQAFEAFIAHNMTSCEATSKFTATRPTRGLGFPMITIITAQELRKSIALPTATSWIDRSIEAIRRNHLKPDLEAVMETVGPAGEIYDHFDGRTLNPGHAMEGAWAIMLEGKERSDDELVQVGCDMLDWSWKRGWDRTHGGILYFVDLYGNPVQEYWHDMKFWWPQNEAIIATLLAHQLTGSKKYAQWHRAIHDWAFERFPDPKHGEWFGYLHRDGSLSSSLKGNLWKGPFHLPRMQWMCTSFLAEMQ